MAAKSFNDKVKLGRTGLDVSRLGIGSSYGVSKDACLRAFERGVNYFFWGSVRTPGMAGAIREISKKSREKAVVVLQCYVRKSFLDYISQPMLAANPDHGFIGISL